MLSWTGMTPIRSKDVQYPSTLGRKWSSPSTIDESVESPRKSLTSTEPDLETSCSCFEVGGYCHEGENCVLGH